MLPPSFLPAVMAPREPELSLPSLCSRMASVEARRARAADWRGERRADDERRPRRAVLRARLSMVS